MATMRSSPLYLGLALSQALTLAGFLTLMGGLAALQKTANGLNIAGIADATAQADLISVYTSTFTSAGPINPYPYHTSWQFEYQWFTLFYELCIFLWVTFLVIMPTYIVRARLPALAFLASALVLIFENVNAVLYLKRSAAANSVFGPKRIKASLAGLLMVGIANGLAIIFLGLIATESHRTGVNEAAVHPRGEKGNVAAADSYTVSPDANAAHLKTDRDMPV